MLVRDGPDCTTESARTESTKRTPCLSAKLRALRGPTSDQEAPILADRGFGVRGIEGTLLDVVGRDDLLLRRRERHVGVPDDREHDAVVDRVDLEDFEVHGLP